MCPTYDDRWELRTRALGCKVSSMTLMTCLGTILCTLAGLLLLMAVVKAARVICAPFAGSGGYEIVLNDADEHNVEALRRAKRAWQDRIAHSTDSR